MCWCRQGCSKDGLRQGPKGYKYSWPLSTATLPVATQNLELDICSSEVSRRQLWLESTWDRHPEPKYLDMVTKPGYHPGYQDCPEFLILNFLLVYYAAKQLLCSTKMVLAISKTKTTGNQSWIQTPLNWKRMKRKKQDSTTVWWFSFHTRKHYIEKH